MLAREREWTIDAVGLIETKKIKDDGREETARKVEGREGSD